MEFSQFSIQALVKEIKGGILSNTDPSLFLSPSAYDTAWLAMIPDSDQPYRPMFENCLNWVLNNQNADGCWGELDGHGRTTIESLPATLACIIVLKRWNSGKNHIQKGLEFLHASYEKLVGENYERCPRRFAIVFPAMVDLARAVGIEILFPDQSKGAMMDIFNKRQQIVQNEELVDTNHYPPLLAYHEALLSSYDINEEHIVKHLSGDGSLFQSPSATASAFMATGNEKCLAYLQSLVQKCSNGVPPTYPIEENLMKLCFVNQLQRLGLADHFNQEIKEVLEQVYLNYKNEESCEKTFNSAATQLYKDSLAFQLLRMHGYSVSPWMYCWFLNNQEILDYIENNHEYFSSTMLNVHRATDLMFADEYEAKEARSFARKSLEKTISAGIISGPEDFTFTLLRKVINHELDLPWFTRLEHLEHRMWIEEKDTNALWMGKTSFHRLSRRYNDKFLQLARQNYDFRQSVYQYELEELKRWSKDKGLADMGFGREKTTYCYFAVASSISLPHDSCIRLLVAKGAILITVADDFFDMRGSLNELKSLTDAVKRWDDGGLNGHSKTIFNALDNLVREAADIHLQQQGIDITSDLKDIWYETFAAWLTEAEWSKSGHIPSMDVYLHTGMISIATHTLVLTASCFSNPSLPSYKLRPAQYETVTKLLMAISRLLNDTQSHQKEIVDGKINFALLYLKENPEADIEDSLSYVREIVATKEKELLEHALMDGFSDLPNSCKQLHLSCMKVFQMFFHSSNRYDSNTEMIDDIRKAIYIPLKPLPLDPIPVSLPNHSGSKKDYQTISNGHFDRSFKLSREKRVTTQQIPRPISHQTISNCHFDRSFKLYSKRRVTAQQIPRPISIAGYNKNMVVPPKLRLSFI